jgi:membrane-associated protease RseP (regulator of RpoE activity)
VRAWAPIEALVLLVVVITGPVFAQPEALQASRDQLEAARKLYDALEWESALPALDGLIASLGARSSSDADVRALLASAYELRARTRFGLENREGARQDLAALVGLAPGHKMPPNVASAFAQMFEEVRKANVGTLALTVTPPDAVVTIDGTRVEDHTAPVSLAVGPRKLMATRGGYRPAERDLVIAPGVQQDVAVELERIASRVAVLTSPGDVEVSLDGVSRGRTPAGPAPETYTESATRLGVGLDRLSSPLYIDDVASGVRLFEFRRPCYVTVESRRQIDRPADLLLEMKLQLAAATVKVESNLPGAEVLVNGQKRGMTPLVLPEVCEGPQVLEVLSPVGRFIRRFEARAGETVDINADIAPALALASVAGEDTRVRGEDARLLAEQFVAPARTLTLFAPPEGEVDAALKEQRLSRDWLGFDANGQPVGQADSVSQSARREASSQLARRFGAQGVAGVTLLPGADGRATLSLLAAGSGEPDVIEVTLGSAAPAVAELDAVFNVLRPAIEALAVDVADVAGAMVVAVEPGSQAAQAGLAPGEAIVGVNGVAVASVLELNRVLASQPTGQPLPVTVIDKAGATRNVSIPVLRRPRIVSTDDRMTRFNKLVLDLRFRLAGVKDPLEETLLRLNLGVALMRLGNWADARRELQRVTLPDGPGVSGGTVQYLLGLCYEALNQPAEADQAFKAAAAVEGSLVTEVGPTVAEAIKARPGRR